LQCSWFDLIKHENKRRTSAAIAARNRVWNKDG
jgi:hypothetical protein